MVSPAARASPDQATHRLTMSQEPTLKHIAAGVLNVAHYESGAADGVRTLLLHGFRYDVRAYDEVAISLRRNRVVHPRANS